MALSVAAKTAVLSTFHGTEKRILQNRHYLDDDFYPTIIEKDTFDSVTTEIPKYLDETN